MNDDLRMSASVVDVRNKVLAKVVSGCAFWVMNYAVMLHAHAVSCQGDFVLPV